ncbi:MAG: replicative DNA helicase [Caldisericaceae bacterium]
MSDTNRKYPVEGFNEHFQLSGASDLEQKVVNMAYSKEAEQSVLGSILLDQKAILEAMRVINEDDFSREEHQFIFKAMKLLWQEGVPIDIVTVFEKLKEMKQNEFAGGYTYLAGLLGSVPSVVNIWYYAKIVREKSIARKAGKIGLEIVELSAKEDLDGIKDKAIELQNLNLKNDIPFKDLFTDEDLERLRDSKRYFSKNLHNLTYRLPFMNGEVIYIAGRTSAGKTQMALNLAMSFLDEGASVGYVSMEVSKEQLLVRLLNWEFGGEHVRLSDIDIRNPETFRLGQKLVAQDKFNNFYFRQDMNELGEISAWIETHNFDVVFIDYIQMIYFGKKVENRNYELGKVAREFRRLSRGRCMVVMSQFNRSKSGDDEEDLSRIRDSGEIEQTSTGIVFVQSKKDADGVFQYSIRKNQTYGVLSGWIDLKLLPNGELKE